jgi:SAM-dependent methyltransferase
MRRSLPDSATVATSSPETWDAFFSEFYLRAYATDERDAEAEMQALAAARLSGCAEGGELLDVPCGFGRHSIPLAEVGYRVTGVDRSQTLIDEAGRRGSMPKFIQADYRELPFPEDTFDAALNLFSSLGYLGAEEDTRALTEIHRVLRPGRRLVIETNHRDLLVTRWSDTDWYLVGEGRLLLEQRTFDPAAGIAQSTQTLIESNGGRESRTWSLRMYTATELVGMLERAGFETARCYGDLEGGPFSTRTRLVIVATA